MGVCTEGDWFQSDSEEASEYKLYHRVGLTVPWPCSLGGKVVFVAEMEVGGEGGGIFSYETALTSKDINCRHLRNTARINLLWAQKSKADLCIPFQCRTILRTRLQATSAVFLLVLVQMNKIHRSYRSCHKQDLLFKKKSPLKAKNMRKEFRGHAVESHYIKKKSECFRLF